MAVEEDQAVCIRRQDYSESSQLLTLFGCEHGKIRCIAKGSRRRKGGFGGGVELLSQGFVQFKVGRGDSGLATLTGFELRKGHPALRQNLLGLNCGLLAGELISRMTEDYDPHEQLYAILERFLEMIGQDDRQVLLLVRFELALLREVGLLPHWHQCGHCRKRIGVDKSVMFCLHKSMLLCGECPGESQQKIRIGPAVLRFLQEPTQWQDVSETTLLRTHQTLMQYFMGLMGREPTIARFVTTLIQQHIAANRRSAD